MGILFLMRMRLVLDHRVEVRLRRECQGVRQIRLPHLLVGVDSMPGIRRRLRRLVPHRRRPELEVS